MSEDKRMWAADLCKQIAQELELASRHSWIAAEHMTAGEVPRACAHAFATIGHMRAADDRLAEWAKFHAAQSSTD